MRVAIQPVHDRYMSALDGGFRSFRNLACMSEVIGAFLKAERGHQRAGQSSPLRASLVVPRTRPWSRRQAILRLPRTVLRRPHNLGTTCVASNFLTICGHSADTARAALQKCNDCSVTTI